MTRRAVLIEALESRALCAAAHGLYATYTGVYGDYASRVDRSLGGKSPLIDPLAGVVWTGAIRAPRPGVYGIRTVGASGLDVGGQVQNGVVYLTSRPTPVQITADGTVALQWLPPHGGGWSTVPVMDLTPAAPAPMALAATAVASNEIDLTWQSDQAVGATYTVSRSDDGGATWTAIGHTFGSFFHDRGADLPIDYTLSQFGLKQATEYSYLVVSSDGQTSPVVDAKTWLAAPTRLEANYPAPFETQYAVLTWQSNSLGEESGFEVDREIGYTGNWVEVAIVPSGATSWTDGPNLPGVYVYRVRALA